MTIPESLVKPTGGGAYRYVGSSLLRSKQEGSRPGLLPHVECWEEKGEETGEELHRKVFFSFKFENVGC